MLGTANILGRRKYYYARTPQTRIVATRLSKHVYGTRRRHAYVYGTRKDKCTRNTCTGRGHVRTRVHVTRVRKKK